MRFKKGIQVEVLSKIDITPSCSWRCAEIVCGNGHTYTVRYADGTVMDRVSDKEIRPCPPPLSGVRENWVPGDVVELFDNCTWKMATISKVLCNEYILVRLLGSLLEFIASRFDIRRRQSWHNGEWIIIGKCFSRYVDTKHDQNLILGINNEILEELNSTSCKRLKRRPYGHDGITEKHRAVEKEGKLQRVVVTNQLLSHDIAFRKETVGGEKLIYSSFDNESRFSEMDMERRLQNGGDVGCSSAIELDSDGEASCGSSVGSCSITGNNSHKYEHHSCFADEDIDSKIRFPTKEELSSKIHMLELDAYRCTMEALYAAGPLSWDKEAMVTNLRLSLHISNEEHLMEVRNLVSADNTIPSR